MGDLKPLIPPATDVDVELLLARLTALRAGYLDNINNANLATIPDISTLSAARIGYLDNINQVGLLQITAARAGYLDNINNANLATIADISSLTATEIARLDADISSRAPASEYDTEMARITANVATEAKQDNIISRAVSCMTFWSDVQLVATIVNGGAGGDVTLPNVVVAEIPSGATIFRVIALLKFRTVEETSGGANALLGDQYVQVDDSGASGYTNAIKLVDNQWTIAASATEGGDCLAGAIDVAARVDGNDTYSFKIATGKADADNLVLNEVQIGLMVYFKV